MKWPPNTRLKLAAAISRNMIRGSFLRISFVLGVVASSGLRDTAGQVAPARDLSKCHKPRVPAFTSKTLPKLGKLPPASRLAGHYQLVLVVESPPDLEQRIAGMLTLSADTEPTQLSFGSPSQTILSGVQLDLSRLKMADAILPRATFDSSLSLAMVVVNRRRETMQIAVGELENTQLLLFVTDLKSGFTGLWVSRGGSDPEAPRGFFCAYAE